MVGILLDSLTTAALLYLVTVGLLIIFGIMRVINFAHGALITAGAYASVVAAQSGLSPWWTLLLGPLAVVAVAAVMEPLVLRPLYGRPLDTILATFGVSLIITQLITLYFGRGTIAVETISLGTVSLFGTSYPAYRLAVLLLVAIMAIILPLILNRTRVGLVGQAVIMNDQLSQALGINVSRVRFISFLVGAGFAGLAGAVLVPMSSVDPYLGLSWLVSAFLISLLIGVSPGALVVACVALGTIQVLTANALNSIVASLVIPVLAVIILRFRPGGFVRARASA